MRAARAPEYFNRIIFLMSSMEYAVLMIVAIVAVVAFKGTLVLD